MEASVVFQALMYTKGDHFQYHSRTPAARVLATAMSQIDQISNIFA